MGNSKLKWTDEEFEALKAGVAKHGVGKWKNIMNDTEFNHLLRARSNIDLKNKWRYPGVKKSQEPSLAASSSHVPNTDAVAVETSKEKEADRLSEIVLEAKLDPVVATGVTVTPLPKVQKSQEPSLAASSSHVPNTDAETSKKKEADRLSEMVLEAISILNEPNGSDHSAISDYIEQNNDIPPNFERNLTQILGMLVQQGKLEKVECYRLKSDVQPGTRTVMNQEEIHHSSLHEVQSVMHAADITLEAAAAYAACKIAEAENKSFLAAEAMKEADRLSSLAEKMASFHQFATDCYEQSAQGDVLLSSRIYDSYG